MQLNRTLTTNMTENEQSVKNKSCPNKNSNINPTASSKIKYQIGYSIPVLEKKADIKTNIQSIQRWVHGHWLF